MGKGMRCHVVFLRDRPLDAILAGEKRHELRLARTSAPFMRCAKSDWLLLKRSGGSIEAVARAGLIDFFVADDGDRLADFVARWSDGDAARAYLRSKPMARFGAAIELAGVRRATFPLGRTPKGVRMGWVADFAVGAWRPPRG